MVLEAANPRHNHEVQLFEKAVQCGHFRADQVIVPGLIDTTAARVEHPALIAERLLRFVRAVGHPSRVIASTDCGFASTSKVRAGSERTIYPGCFRNDMHGTHTDRLLPSQTTHSA